MTMNSKFLPVLRSGHTRALPMLTSSLPVPVYAAVTRLSSVAANPMFCSPRFSSSVTPAPIPTTKPKPTTKVDTFYKQPTDEIQRPVKETKKPAVSPEHTTVSCADERGQNEMLITPQEPDEVKLEKLRAELMAMHESPNGATTGYELFIEVCYRSPTFTEKYKSAWKELSEIERQQFAKEARINLLRAAEYDKCAQALGYLNIVKINRDRVRFGKKRLRIPASLRPERKVLGFKAFFQAKVASGEVSYSKGRAAARKRTGELWRQLTPSQKAVYHDQWVADCEQRRATSSQA
ncbi:hypothetical protein BKA62DRAFT_674609 [Auriculariales sp. MPI-PUGE-AT-0066]|nr:hypothetical protein BKA62DRAFT_674609 [Auriculariales sp. MPI-PUGE-AT-0066]